MATATATPPKTLDDLLDEVVNYARKIHAPSAADRLEWLKKLVHGTPAQREALASNDLHQLLDVSGLVEGLKVGHATPTWLGVLEWIRNILVLVPLVLTWFAISQAVPAYQNLLAADKADYSNTPFIYLWQQGFGGTLPDIFRLGSLATIDAGILFTLVVFTLVVSGRAHVYNNQKERSAEKLRADLADVLAQVKLSLATNPYNTQQPTNFVSYFDQVSQQLMGVIQQERTVLDHLVAQGQQNLQQQSQLNQTLGQVMTETQRTMQAIQQTGQTFTQAAGSLVQASQAVQQATQTLQSLVQQVNTSATNLEQAVKGLTAEQARLVATGNNIVAGLQIMHNKQDALLNQEGQMVAEQARIVAQLDTLSQRVQQSVATLEQDVKDLGKKADDVIVTLGVAGTAVLNLVNVIDTLNNRQAVYVNSLQQAQQDQQALVKHLESVAGSVTNAVNQLPNLKITMEGVWTEANNTVRRMAELPSRVQANLDTLLRAHQLAAGELVQGSHILKDASTELQTGVVQLKRYFP